MVEGLAGVAGEVEGGGGGLHRGLLLGPGGEAQDAPSWVTTGRREGNRQAEAVPGLVVAGAASAASSWRDGPGSARWLHGRDFAVARDGGVPRGLRLAGRRGEICPERTGNQRHGYCPRFFGRRHRRTRQASFGLRRKGAAGGQRGLAVRFHAAVCGPAGRSEEPTSALQSLLRLSFA